MGAPGPQALRQTVRHISHVVGKRTNSCLRRRRDVWSITQHLGDGHNRHSRAGVSVMTVSKVLRDAPDISTATKTRIRSLAHDMGYMPDSLAQGLRTRSTHLFGLVISSL